MRYYYTKVIKNIISISFLLFLVFLISPACAKKEKDYYIVTEIHDGDTVSIITSSFFGAFVKTEKVRLIGIDAPELGQEPWGKRAKNHLKKIIKETA